MKRYQISSLLIVAVMSTFWAYTIMDTILRKFSKDVTYIDLGAIYFLGLLSGITLGLVLAFRRK
jgi:hypothetical protein